MDATAARPRQMTVYIQSGIVIILQKKNKNKKVCSPKNYGFCVKPPTIRIIQVFAPFTVIFSFRISRTFLKKILTMGIPIGLLLATAIQR